MVNLCKLPKLLVSLSHNSEQNWTPLSDVITSGTPNLAIQPWMKASATAAVVVLDRGMASSHLVDLSIIVRMWLRPFGERGRGPTRSI